MSDPRATIKTLLSEEVINANLTKDDDATELAWHVLYEPNLADLPALFHDKKIDLFFGIKDAGPCSTRYSCSHTGLYGVTPYAIDKFDSGGKRVITATVVLWKALKELRRVFKANPWGSLRNLVDDKIEVHDFGDTQVWSKPCQIEYKTYTS